MEILFKQRFNERIIARRNEIEPSSDPSRRLRAYNQAVSSELGRFKEESPESYEELRRLAEEMKAAATQDFDGQPEEVQEA